jgi:hypothetical protein
MRRPDFFLFTGIGFSHADDVADIASLGIANDDHSAVEVAEADEALFTIIPSFVLELGNRALENFIGTLEIKLPLSDGLQPLSRIV